jgi:hypothetical protein
VKITEVRWVVVDGSIYTADTVEMRSDFSPNRTIYNVPNAVAFNVGDRLANHIVELHNASLKDTS